VTSFFVFVALRHCVAIELLMLFFNNQEGKAFLRRAILSNVLQGEKPQVPVLEAGLKLDPLNLL